MIGFVNRPHSENLSCPGRLLRPMGLPLGVAPRRQGHSAPAFQGGLLAKPLKPEIPKVRIDSRGVWGTGRPYIRGMRAGQGMRECLNSGIREFGNA
ncbi:hypothetical protein AchV4_0062 [Achromobacter phage vB_AchrS_AchV4]|uniref:Uncharacterized protein n=1 Tax=Achromobacter phage vB_AchrS_AchV4 TaxID=2796514 RepID=A0A7T3U746_9CAUD|nr:hypothetical protein JT316_gp62 [Achromobacter phage vB_AchrS_AchV4]QPZ53293.1 hypothetical protein AchV4_0062 [Achromobacter phage vB_AchrS_AchV4]